MKAVINFNGAEDSYDIEHVNGEFYRVKFRDNGKETYHLEFLKNKPHLCLVQNDYTSAKKIPFRILSITDDEFKIKVTTESAAPPPSYSEATK